MDQEGDPHIIGKYSGFVGMVSLFYVYRNENGWQTEVINSGLENDIQLYRLTIDRAGFPHVSYIYVDHSIIRLDQYLPVYVYQDATGWIYKSLGAEHNTFSPFDSYSLAVDAYRSSHLSYIHSQQLVYLYLEAGQ